MLSTLYWTPTIFVAQSFPTYNRPLQHISDLVRYPAAVRASRVDKQLTDLRAFYTLQHTEIAVAGTELENKLE